VSQRTSRSAQPDHARLETIGRTSTVRHRVAFYETDAMGIVHHTNYVRFFENARVVWLDEHDRPYVWWQAEAGLDFAVTRVEANYVRSARFDDWLEITTWMEWVRGASLRMAYRVERDGELVATGATEHAAVDREGRVRRIPRERRASLRAASGPSPDEG
jgi:acyl-CoA thioester hydrolase